MSSFAFMFTVIFPLIILFMRKIDQRYGSLGMVALTTIFFVTITLFLSKIGASPGLDTMFFYYFLFFVIYRLVFNNPQKEETSAPPPPLPTRRPRPVINTPEPRVGNSPHKPAPYQAAPPSNQPAPSPGNLIDINLAHESALATLPGMGTLLAKKAILFREKERPFHSVEDFAQVLNLKPHILESMRSRVTVTAVSTIKDEPSVPRGRIIDF